LGAGGVFTGWSSGAIVLACLSALLVAPVRAQQEPDTTFDTRVARPAYTSGGPRLLFDEAHHEFHRIAGRYRPSAELAHHDGYRVVANADGFWWRSPASR